MGEAHVQSISMAAVAWVVALALAAAIAAAAAAAAYHRRWKETTRRLRSLEDAVAEFRSAVEARLAAERARRSAQE